MELIFPVDRLNSRPTVRIAHPVGADAKLQHAWVVPTTWGETYIPIEAGWHVGPARLLCEPAGVAHLEVAAHHRH